MKKSLLNLNFNNLHFIFYTYFFQTDPRRDAGSMRFSSLSFSLSAVLLAQKENCVLFFMAVFFFLSAPSFKKVCMMSAFLETDVPDKGAVGRALLQLMYTWLLCVCENNTIIDQYSYSCLCILAVSVYVVPSTVKNKSRHIANFERSGFIINSSVRPHTLWCFPHFLQKVLAFSTVVS